MNRISIKIWLPIIVVALAVFGLLVYFNWPKEEVKIPEIEIPKKETFEIPDDWKTYRNEGYGYEIKYPGDWHSDSSGPTRVYFNDGKETTIEGLSIQVIRIFPEVSLFQAAQNQFFKDYGKEVEFTQKNFTLGKIEGLEIISICEDLGCGGPEWFVVKDNYLFHFRPAWRLENTYKMLSTFRFLK